MGYEKDAFKEMIKEYKEDKEDKGYLYQATFVNYKGNVVGEKIPYTEVASEIISEKLLDNSNLESVAELTRKKSYKTPAHHKSEKIEIKNNNRIEENLAKWIYCLANEKTPKTKEPDFGITEYPFNNENIGKILDYQIPLKNVQKDKIGKIDLLSYNEGEKILYMIEFKKNGSKETLLRASLEIQTYFQTVDQEKLKNDFEIDKEVEIKKVVLIYEKSQSGGEFNNIADRPHLEELLKKLKIIVCLLDDKHQPIDWKEF